MNTKQNIFCPSLEFYHNHSRHLAQTDFNEIITLINTNDDDEAKWELQTYKDLTPVKFIISINNNKWNLQVTKCRVYNVP